MLQKNPDARGAQAEAAPHCAAVDPCDASARDPHRPEWMDTIRPYDLLIQCGTGLAQLNGSPQEPVKTAISVADIAAGMYSFAGILAALFERQTTHRGSAVDISLLESLGEWISAPLLMASGSGQVPNGQGLAHTTISPYGPYRTRDGVVVIAVQNEREFARFVRAIGRPDLLKDPTLSTNSGRVGHRDELDAAITAFTTQHPTDEVCRRLDAADIANCRLAAVTDFARHPQLEARGRWRGVETPNGRIRSLLPPLASANGDHMIGRVPALGEDTDRILDELGLGPDKIAALRQRGAI